MTRENNLSGWINKKERWNPTQIIQPRKFFTEFRRTPKLRPMQFFFFHGFQSIFFFLVDRNTHEFNLITVTPIHFSQMRETGPARTTPRCPKIDKRVPV